MWKIQRFQETMKCYQCNISFATDKEYREHMEKYHGYAEQ